MKFAKVSNSVLRIVVVLLFCSWMCNGWENWTRKFLSCDDCQKAMTRIAKVLGKDIKNSDQFVQDYKKLIESEPNCNKDIACCSKDVDTCAKDIFDYVISKENNVLDPEQSCLVIGSCDFKVETLPTEPSATVTTKSETSA